MFVKLGSKAVLRLVFLAAVAVAAAALLGKLLTPVSAVAADGSDGDLGQKATRFVSGELLIKYKEDYGKKTSVTSVRLNRNSVAYLHHKFSVEAEEKLVGSGQGDLSRVSKLKLPNGVDVLKAAEEYSKSPEVEYAEPNFLLTFDIVPSDTSFSTQQNEYANIQAEEAWNITIGSASVVIAIIDTGVDWNHPDLAANIWNNSDEVLNGSDSDGNGYVDDIRGYDFTNINTTQYENDSYTLIGGEDYTGIDNNPMDFNGHGTHTSGIAAAVTNNSVGVAGTCWNCTIMAVRAGFSIIDPNGDTVGLLETDDIANALHYAADNNATIISMSFGGSNSSTMQNAIEYAANKSVILVASAGNSNTNATTYPAAYKQVIAVAATDNSDAKASFSSYGSWVSFAAPGVGIYSTYFNDTYATAQGTSMSAPMVAGAIGLLRAYNGTINSTQAVQALNSTGLVLTNFGASGLNITRINVFKALLALDSTPPNVTFIATTPANNSVINGSSITVNITSNESLTNAFLEWNLSVNYTMSGTGATWRIVNQSNLSNGNSTFRVFANDSAGNFGVSATRTVFINNTAPNINSFFPTLNLSTVEPNNQTFNVTVNDSNNDVISFTWLRDSSSVGTAHNFSFLGNYTSNSTYNITVVVSDGSLSARRQWNFTVNNTNRMPTWNVQPQNSTIGEDINLTINLSANDADNDSITYYLNNSGNFTINSTNGSITYNATADFFGTFWLNVSAGDAESNVSEVIFVNITPVNDTPRIHAVANISVNETDFANITVVADDAENDFLNFTVNDTLRFNFTARNQSAANFSWKTNLSDSGTYNFRVNVTDFNSSSVGFFNVTVVDRPDFDGDGVPDIYDSDDDNDGIADGDDSVLGNVTTINSSTISAAAFNVTVNSSVNLSRIFNGTFFVNVTNGTRPLVEFFWNFSQGNLSFNFTVDVQNSTAAFGGILVKGLRLQQNQTKNITVQNVNSTINSTCIKDADVASLDNISGSCNGLNETLVQCPGAFGGYNCSLSDDGAYYRITGANFTAAKEQCPDTDADGYYNSSCGSGNDCDDGRAGVNPGAAEVCGNGLDDDCSGGDAVCPSTLTSGSSGGGGGGGGAATPVLGAGTLAKVSQVFTAVRAGETAVMRINKSGIAFTKVRFTAAAALSSISMDVELLNVSNVSARLLLPSAGRFAVYQYFRVTSKLTFLDISDAGIEFRVPKAWLAGQGYSPKQVALFRYSGGSWDKFVPVLFAEDSDYYYYSAELPAFSLFAVAAEEAKAPAAAVAGNESSQPVQNITVVAAANETAEISRGEMAERLLGKRGKIIVATAAAAVILFVLIFIRGMRRLREQDKVSDFVSRISRIGRK